MSLFSIPFKLVMTSIVMSTIFETLIYSLANLILKSRLILNLLGPGKVSFLLLSM